MGKTRKTKQEVKRADGRKGIVDLFLTQKIPGPRVQERDYLIVELKAPSVKIGQKETAQIKSYAYALQEDEEFRNLKVRWEFWVVSTDLDEFARRESTSRDRPQGMLDRGDNFEIWVKTWSEVLNECRARLQMFERELNYDADRDESLELLRSAYARFLSPEPKTKDVMSNDARG